MKIWQPVVLAVLWADCLQHQHHRIFCRFVLLDVAKSMELALSHAGKGTETFKLCGHEGLACGAALDARALISTLLSAQRAIS